MKLQKRHHYSNNPKLVRILLIIVICLSVLLAIEVALIPFVARQPEEIIIVNVNNDSVYDNGSEPIDNVVNTEYNHNTTYGEDTEPEEFIREDMDTDTLTNVNYIRHLINIDYDKFEQLHTTDNTRTEYVGIMRHRYPSEIIDELESVKKSYTDEDVKWLAAVMYCEAGSSWITDEQQLLFGQVVLNRVNSPEFPSTVKRVVNQPGQYHPEYFYKQVPDERTINNAIRLLEGDGPDMPASVVFQDTRAHGKVWKAIYIDHLGTTYFCYSPNTHLYE